MILLHVAPVNWQRPNGPGVSVPALVTAQNALEGIEAALLNTFPAPQELDLPFPVFSLRETPGPGGRLGLPAPFDRPDLAVFHCPYVRSQAAIARRLVRLGVPYVLCPRGGMTRQAVSHKKWKKRLGNLLFFRRMVDGARALHCLTEREADESAHWQRPAFVVSNGVDLPSRSGGFPPGGRASGTPRSSPDRRLVFIGRLAARHKGLDLLVDACALARPHLVSSGARVELYGPDHQGDGKRIAERIAALELGGLVQLRGPISGGAKEELLGRADVFLHTSRWEGLPMAVLEALARGVPCLLTPGTNVASEVARAGAGWQVEPTPAGIAARLRQVVRSDRGELAAASAEARALAAGQYAWPQVAARSVEAYRRYAA